MDLSVIYTQESCMLLGGRKTTDIPLEGYLLSPIQRICKYPLLFKELAKRTPGKHPDHPVVQSALQAMKTVCSNINETKRQMEKLEALERLQSHIEGWEGSNLTDICTQLLLQGTLLKISAGNIQERAFFLFDNLLVYCKWKSRCRFVGIDDAVGSEPQVCWWLDALIREREQRESLKLGMERDAYVMIAEKGEKLYHMMMSKKVNLIKDRGRKLSTVPKCFLGNIHHAPPPVLPLIVHFFTRDRDYHLKTYKSVVPGSKLVDWLLAQGDCQTREEAVALHMGLCNNGFMHHVLEKSEFKDESQYFCFHADEEMGGTSSKNKPLHNDFRLLENILAKRLLIPPQEDDYGFDLEEKNKAVVVKSVPRGSLAEMAGLQVGRKIYSINEDLVFLRPFSEVETILNQSFSSHRPLHLLVATKAKETIKVPDHPEALSFQIRGAAPLCVFAVGRGSEAMAAGLCAGQCILKVNGSSVANDGALEVLEHFQAFRSHWEEALGLYQWVYHSHEDAQQARASQGAPDEDSQEDDQPDSALPLLSLGPQLSLHEDGPVVSLTLDNVHLEDGVVYEYVSTAGAKCHVLERIVEPRGCFRLAAKILEAFAADDSIFVQNCGRLMAMSSGIITMSHYEFHNICDTKLESISQRIACYQEFAAQLKSRVSPPHFKQAPLEPHLLCGLDFCPTNCHINLMEVSTYPKTTPSVGRSFSIRFGRKPSLIGLDPEQGHLNPMAYTQHCITTMAAPSWKCSFAVNGDSQGQGLNDSSFGSATGGLSQQDWGLSFLLKQEDREIQDVYLQLFTKLDVALKEMKQYISQINRLLSTITEPVVEHLPNTELQLHCRDTVFCQALVAAVCTFSEQLLAALDYRSNNNGEHEESSRDASCKWLEQVVTTGILLHWQSLLAPATVKEERTMLEDIWVTLSELDNVTFSFKQLDEMSVANTSVFYHIEGSRQALKVVFYLNGFHFSRLPSCLEGGISLRLHTVLFTKALENVEGPPPPGSQATEDLQQEINTQSLEKVQQYYRKLRAFDLERSNLPTDAGTTAVKIDQEYPECVPGTGSHPGVESQAAAPVCHAGHRHHAQAGSLSGDFGQNPLNQGPNASRCTTPLPPLPASSGWRPLNTNMHPVRPLPLQLQCERTWRGHR
ncbi:LOW QUALITY PROTEIN: phosphatidylinositol 3,4,5-trisphosphate-dependent Rac exchanger 1 protein-like [Onychomys torridus]|uniref:LOW QUALITY PROTEIN: phosphatidylinositol 3,4,5-trisphosphate-dependent Rac exchanger 1 protein-like n=1 Tax=Onychomys torridus TaxID=38674 RepID=UPI00167F29E2|nr:LOW QUALITY PROTEIN: phosphatidylinositol 3,4,5-trisphosphate-dependent Rac exchanger 1 protein-like [Onychomys torridus]